MADKYGFDKLQDAFMTGDRRVVDAAVTQFAKDNVWTIITPEGQEVLNRAGQQYFQSLSQEEKEALAGLYERNPSLVPSIMKGTVDAALAGVTPAPPAKPAVVAAPKVQTQQVAPVAGAPRPPASVPNVPAVIDLEAPKAAQSNYALGGRSTAGVNAALVAAVTEGARAYEELTGNKVVVTPAGALDARSSTQWHPAGLAIDVQIYDANGKALANGAKEYSRAATAAAFRDYETLAQSVYNTALQKNPAIAESLRWGGYFVGGWRADTMHFDIGGKKVGMAGGSWDKGATKDQLGWLGASAYSIGLKDVAAQQIDALGYRGPNAVKDFQEAVGIKADGKFGPQTAAALQTVVRNAESRYEITEDIRPGVARSPDPSPLAPELEFASQLFAQEQAAGRVSPSWEYSEQLSRHFEEEGTDRLVASMRQAGPEQLASSLEAAASRAQDRVPSGLGSGISYGTLGVRPEIATAAPFSLADLQADRLARTSDREAGVFDQGIPRSNLAGVTDRQAGVIDTEAPLPTPRSRPELLGVSNSILNEGDRIAKGSNGPVVASVQSFLNARGVTDDRGRALEVDGVVGPLTRQAIKNYQEQHAELKVDGVVGPRTLATMMRDVEERQVARSPMQPFNPLEDYAAMPARTPEVATALTSLEARDPITQAEVRSAAARDAEMERQLNDDLAISFIPDSIQNVGRNAGQNLAAALRGDVTFDEPVPTSTRSAANSMAGSSQAMGRGSMELTPEYDPSYNTAAMSVANTFSEPRSTVTDAYRGGDTLGIPAAGLREDADAIYSTALGFGQENDGPSLAELAARGDDDGNQSLNGLGPIAGGVEDVFDAGNGPGVGLSGLDPGSDIDPTGIDPGTYPGGSDPGGDVDPTGIDPGTYPGGSTDNYDPTGYDAGTFDSSSFSDAFW